MPTISEPRDRDILYAKAHSVRFWFIEGSLGEAPRLGQAFISLG